MSTFLILEYASCSTTALFVQIVGLIFLYRPKIPSPLFHTESACLTRSILYFIISPVDLLWCLDIYLVKLYYFFMMMLTLDRLLDFYWNIKYSIYFRPKKIIENPLLNNSCIYNNICFDFSFRNKLYKNSFFDSKHGSTTYIHYLPFFVSSILLNDR